MACHKLLRAGGPTPLHRVQASEVTGLYGSFSLRDKAAPSARALPVEELTGTEAMWRVAEKEAHHADIQVRHLSSTMETQLGSLRHRIPAQAVG